MNQYEYNGIKRISKRQAEKLYNEGKPVYILPCKVRFENAWIRPYRAQKNEEIRNNGGEEYSHFETIINAFTYYNCNYNELGKYPAYYIELEA